MAASMHCGQARIRTVSHAAHAVAGTAAMPAPGDGREAVPEGRRPPLPPAGRQGGSAWEEVYPGTEDQLTRMRAALGPLLRDCPMADDAILLMSELGGNAVRHTRSREDGSTFTARLVDVPGEYVLGEVEDGGSDWDGDLRRSARDASGLWLLMHMSAACGVSGEPSKRVVWFRLPYPSAGPVVADPAEGDA